MRTRNFGPGALLVETGDPWRSLTVAEKARAEGWAAEVVPGAETVLLDGVADVAAVERRLADLEVAPTVPEGDLVEVPVDYSGDDLDQVAAAWSVEPREVVARHTAVEWVAVFAGFSPGFTYLATTADWPSVARRASPRPRVPAGAVALADRWSAVYPSATPGGWQLLGGTHVALWDAARDDPALLTPGTRVRFVAG